MLVGFNRLFRLTLRVYQSMHSTAGASLPLRKRSARLSRYSGSSMSAAHAALASTVAWLSDPGLRPPVFRPFAIYSALSSTANSTRQIIAW